MEIDVANNIKAVELLKVELLQAVTDLMSDITAGADDETTLNLSKDFASIEIVSAVLRRRLGIERASVEAAVIRKLKAGIKDGSFLENHFGDLTMILKEVSEGQIGNEKYEG